ncbi:MAG: DUF6282 family protein [Solirubrobacterales bacterium]
MSAHAPAAPVWATEMADLHLHPAPSLLARHHDDRGTIDAAARAGFSTVVLKAHEGSTVERASAAGPAAHGGVVLNRAVGGANPDAVEVAARLGGRVIWMPTLSAPAHKAAAASSELAVHGGFELGQVDVLDPKGALLPEWLDVLDAVAAHDLLLASGHLTADEAVLLFAEARRRGVRRLLVNHPLLAFVALNREAAAALAEMGAYLEIGVLADLLAGQTSLALTEEYPTSLLAFGSDLGHADYPEPSAVIGPWLASLEDRVGAERAREIMTRQTRELLLP